MSDQRDPETYAIIGAAMEVHNTLSYGFLEPVYHEALTIELTRAGIPFRRECALPITYKDTVLTCHYRADLICFKNVLVELKALTRLSGAEDGQILNYLRASGLEKGLLINFGTPKLEYKRFRR
jgi:GxxExxY protein